MESFMASPSPYWFRAKRYGWGWGLPLCWQGWAVMAVFAAVLIVDSVYLGYTGKAETYYAVLAVDTLALIAACWAKGEPPKWRWGEE
jgi:hypothetical protein